MLNETSILWSYSMTQVRLTNEHMEEAIKLALQEETGSVLVTENKEENEKSKLHSKVQ